ncbi:MAG: hypothetical protein ACJAQT_001373 [Akkermansiaceae bacterium]|jgi:hypothetical protein
MKPKHPNHNLPDFDSELENDAVWNLLEDSSPANPSPRFVQDTLRRVRLDAAPSKSPWWKSLLAPMPLLGTAGTALAALAIFVSLPSNSVAPQNTDIAEITTPAENWIELEDAVAGELLSGAAEDPSLLSDEEIVALLF